MGDDPHKLTLTIHVEQLRDPILREIGIKLSLRNREVAALEEENRSLRKQLAMLRSPMITAEASSLPVDLGSLATTAPGRVERMTEKRQHLRTESWLLAHLRVHGPQSMGQIVKTSGRTYEQVNSMLQRYRERITRTGTRGSYVYALNEAAACA